MLKCLVLLVVTCGLAGPVSADVYIESTVLGIPSYTWTRGLKNRTEIPILVLGGRLIVITRLNRRVKWTLDPKAEVYQEELLALPYPPDSARGAPRPEGAGVPEISLSQGTACTARVTQLSRNQKIAGYTTTGHQITCEERPEKGLIVWLAPVAGKLFQIEQETQAYEAASMRARYENYPDEEQPKMPMGMSRLGNLLGTVFTNILGGGEGLPSGFPLAVEGLNQTEPHGEPEIQTLFRVQEISVERIDPDFFRIPSGYRKVESLDEIRMRGMLEQLKLEGVVEKIQQILERVQEVEGIHQP